MPETTEARFSESAPVSSLQPVYLQCRDCANRFRIERLEPQTYIGLPRICPHCGSEKVQCGVDTERDYWYSLASALGFEPTEKSANLVRELFNLWDGREHRTFRQFVEAVKHED